jgi:hypothetical protein
VHKVTNEKFQKLTAFAAASTGMRGCRDIRNRPRTPFHRFVYLTIGYIMAAAGKLFSIHHLSPMRFFGESRNSVTAYFLTLKNSHLT